MKNKLVIQIFLSSLLLLLGTLFIPVHSKFNTYLHHTSNIFFYKQLYNDDIPVSFLINEKKECMAIDYGVVMCVNKDDKKINLIINYIDGKTVSYEVINSPLKIYDFVYPNQVIGSSYEEIINNDDVNE